MRWALLPVVSLLACVGPEAPDAVVCRDVIARLCGAPRCGVVEAQLEVGTTCDAELTQRTGCGSDDFVFVSPTRQRFLDCRAPMVREGASVSLRPACEDVTQAFTQCPELVTFLKGAP